jgi:hypothetical protein
MPERWEMQVRQLKEMEAPTERIWTRVGEGPRPDRPPSRPQRAVAVVVAFAVFIVGALAAWSALRPSSGTIGSAAGGTKAVVIVKAPSQTGGDPEAVLDNGLSQADAALDEYLWEGKSHAEPFPPDISSYLSIVQGTPLDVRGNDQPDRTWVFLADPQSFAGIDGTAGVLSEVADSLLMVAPGNYVLVIQQSWGCRFASPSSTSCFVSGERSAHQSLLTFYFGITIVPSAR